MKVESIDHVAIQVRDLQKAKRFFADLFGTKFTDLGEVEEMDVRSSIDRLGIELIEPLTPNGVTAKSLERRGEGLTLLSLKVSSLEEAVAEMESKGIRLIGRIEHEKMKAALFHPKDIYGVMIELIEYEPKHPIVAATSSE
jgi:methylmalonyl-CoA epimerase